jgi:hypothetical protein
MQVTLLARLYINKHWAYNDALCISTVVSYKHTFTVFPTNVKQQQQQQQRTQRHGVTSQKDRAVFCLTLFQGTKTLRIINESNGSRDRLRKEPAAALISATVTHVPTN